MLKNDRSGDQGHSTLDDAARAWRMREQPSKIPERPLCPACGDSMHLVRVVPRGSYIAEQAVFQCERCHVAITRTGDAVHD